MPKDTMRQFQFQQVDVFTSRPLSGNPLAVVIGADGLPDEQMAALARWTGLSETTFLLEPTRPEADYRVRIFTQRRELPFAGHPTLGTCHVWLATGGKPRGEAIVQECGVGLVPIRREGGRLAFAAPERRRAGPVEPELLLKIARSLRITPDAIQASQWADNGSGWVAVLLRSRSELLALKPDYAEMAGIKIGVAAQWDPPVDGTDAQFELRAFAPDEGVLEDPVTGSLNASVAQWLIGAGLAPSSYVASQGTVLGRAGRVFIEFADRDIWVGGNVVTCVEGVLTL